MAGAALGDIYLRFARQAWHLWHWVARLGRFWSRVTPVTPRHFAWQAWHLATSTFVSRGRRGTWRHLPSFCVAGVALSSTSVARRFWLRVTLVTPRHFAWQAWHLATSTFVSRRHLPSFCVAGVALVALDGALVSVLVRGDAGDAAALCVAGVALGDIHLCFTWQARHLATSTFVLRGRCGTYGTGWRASIGFGRTLRGRGGTHDLSFVTNTHITFTHTSLSHTHHFHTHTHTIFHTTLSHTHTPSFTHNSVTHTHDLSSSHTIFHIALNHAQLLCLSFLPRPCYNIWCSFLEEVDL